MILKSLTNLQIGKEMNSDKVFTKIKIKIRCTTKSEGMKIENNLDMIKGVIPTRIMKSQFRIKIGIMRRRDTSMNKIKEEIVTQSRWVLVAMLKVSMHQGQNKEILIGNLKDKNNVINKKDLKICQVIIMIRGDRNRFNTKNALNIGATEMNLHQIDIEIQEVATQRENMVSNKICEVIDNHNTIVVLLKTNLQTFQEVNTKKGLQWINKISLMNKIKSHKDMYLSEVKMNSLIRAKE